MRDDSREMKHTINDTEKVISTASMKYLPVHFVIHRTTWDDVFQWLKYFSEYLQAHCALRSW